MAGSTPSSVVHTLETLIAPGKRARLSPFVESAQFRYLFGESPDEKHRSRDAQRILAKHEEKIQHIARHWDTFSEAGKDFASNDYMGEDFLDTYLTYYFSVNVPKVQLVLLDLVREGKLSGDINLLDIGVGTGTTAVAVLDFLLVWGQVCALYQEPFPITGLRLHGIDQSDGCYCAAMALVGYYAEALEERLISREKSDDRPTAGAVTQQRDTLEQVRDWARSATWDIRDVESEPIEVDEPPNLVVMSNIWNELQDPGRRNVEAFLRELPESSIAVAIEPRDDKKASNLMRWRRRFLRENNTFTAIGPCGQEFGNQLPASCDTCWNSRREAFHQTSLYHAFREASVGVGRSKEKNEKRFDEFQNRLLSWSYVVLQKTTATVEDGVTIAPSLNGSKSIEEPVMLRFLDRRWQRKEPHNSPPLGQMAKM